MKITQIMLASGFGGAERYFTDLSVALAGRNHKVQVICNEHFQALEKFGYVPGITVKSLNVMGWWDPVASYRIKHAIREYSPDVVHAHLSRAAHIAGRAIRDLNIPLVVKTHNYVNMKYFRNVNCFIATTADQQRYLLEHNVSEEKIVVIPNFSLLPCVETAKPRISDHVTFVSYGRMVRKKGFDILLRSFQKLCDSGINARLKLGGEGPERDFLQKLAKKLGIEDRVIFYGWINDVGEFLADTDIFVLPSTDEPFGIVILEAMSHGIPIITTSTRGPSEILNNDLAYFVRAGDDLALSEMMRYVTVNREDAMLKAQRSLERYKKEYSGEIVIPRIEEVYGRLCNQPPSNLC
jgi:glycosyltransferase involved in cell wall biosynthesis